MPEPDRAESDRSESQTLESETVEPRPLETRSAVVSTVYAVFGLVFFFGVGLAGGAGYRVYTNDIADAQLAAATPPVPVAPEAPPPPLKTATAEPAPLTPVAPSDNGPAFAAPKLADITPTAPPSVLPPPEPAPSAAATPAPPSAPPVAAAAPPAAAPKSAHDPAPRIATAVPPKKPQVAAKSSPHAAPEQTVVLHEPPAAPGNAAGPFRVQFGAFANEENARRVQWAVEATGMKVEVTHAPAASGHSLFYLRSPSFGDYAAALSAAQSVQNRAQNFVNAIPIEYAILGDRNAAEQQAQAR